MYLYQARILKLFDSCQIVNIFIEGGFLLFFDFCFRCENFHSLQETGLL